MTNEQEKQGREEFEVVEPKVWSKTRDKGKLPSEYAWQLWEAAKQSSQAIIDAKDRELEAERKAITGLQQIIAEMGVGLGAEREKVRVLREGVEVIRLAASDYQVKSAKASLQTVINLAIEALAATSPEEPKEE